MKLTTKEITQSAVFAALICIMSVITVPASPVPLTLGLFAIMLTPIVLGAKKGVLSVLIYIFAGALGLPVFSGFQGGLQILAGPTGGYIISYIFTALLIGIVSDRTKTFDKKAFITLFFSCILGLLISYAFGTLHYQAITSASPKTALVQCFLIFLPFDIIKTLAAAVIGLDVRHRLKLHFRF